MKQLKPFYLLAALACLVSISSIAFGANDRETTATPEPKKLAEYERQTMFSPTPNAQLVTIYDNGKVVYSYQEMGEEDVDTQLAKLTTAQTKKLKKVVNSITTEALVDRNAGEPECQDAPVSDFNIFRSGQPTMKIQMYSGCHTWGIQGWNNAQAVDTIVKILEGFVALSYLQ